MWLSKTKLEPYLTVRYGYGRNLGKDIVQYGYSQCLIILCFWTTSDSNFSKMVGPNYLKFCVQIAL